MKSRIIAAAIAGSFALATLASAAPAQAQSTTQKSEQAKPKRSIGASVTAFRDRQKKCSAEWKEAKAGGTTKGQKWPQFWSACNKRLKAAGA
jgi:hypothetical protein